MITVRGRRTPLLAFMAASALALGLAGTASAAPAKGPSLKVSASTNLKAGQVVTVSGSGFDVNKGVYVAFCVAPKPGLAPTPCGGAPGGETASSAVWVASNPPPYGKGMTTPFKKGGSFKVPVAVSTSIGEFDCTVVQCGIAARADHRRSSDRSQDVFVPVSFS